jgi:hypothetical protein
MAAAAAVLLEDTDSSRPAVMTFFLRGFTAELIATGWSEIYCKPESVGFPWASQVDPIR